MRILGLFILLQVFPLLTGCGGDREPASGAGADGPVTGGTAVIAFPAEPDVLNPLLYKSAFSGMLMVLLVDSLLEMDEDFRYEPRIARFLSYSPDSLTVDVALRPWCWQDGSPLTADDVEATWRLFTDPRVASPRAGGSLANVAAVTAVAPDTVRYVFHERRADQEGALLHLLMPLAATGRLDPGQVTRWPLNTAPVSCGPFRLEEWVHDRHLTLARNDEYPGIQPHLDRVLFRIIPDETARFLELESGGVDLMADIPPHLARRIEGGDEFVVARTGGRLIGMVYWNHEDDLFRDRRVRKALSLAMDRDAIVSGQLDGYGRPAAGPVPPAVWAYAPDVAPDSFDPERAATLLEEAGWRDEDGDGVRERDGRPFRFTMLTRKGDPVRENSIVILRENLAEVGVEMTPRVLEFSAAIDRVRRGDFAAYLGVFSARLSMDPSGLLSSRAFDRWNYGRYASARADSLMDLGLSLTDRDAAREVWREFQRHMAFDQPMAFLYHPDVLVAHHRRLRGVRPHVLSPYNNIREWWVAPQDRRYDEAPRRQ